MSEAVTLQTLLGERGIEHALICLGSVRTYSLVPLQFCIHDDGTLSKDSIERLGNVLPGMKIVTREEADDAAAVTLRSLPCCRQARASNPLFLKLLDLTISADAWVYYVDTDVLFLRPFVGLFEPRSDAAAIFMHDEREAYSLRPWYFAPFGKLQVVSRVKTGIVSCPTDFIDYEFLEYFMREWGKRPVALARGSWLEQTCWAALATRRKTLLLDPDQFVVANPRRSKLSSRTVATHLVTPARFQLETARLSQTDPASKQVMTKCVRSSRCTPGRMLISDLRGKIPSDLLSRT